MDSKFSKPYNHKETEDKIYRLWESSGYFNPDNLPQINADRRVDKRRKKIRVNQRKNPRKSAFTIIMPPPNANGSLHFGHALFVTIEDLMTRYHRMKGEKVLWLPGADHAGFETQVVFDKKLEKEGRNRFDTPRGELYKEIWEFTQKNKRVMENQLRKLGASCDWSREKFTLDKDIIEIVYDTFKKLYEDGLAYRDFRVINWCTKHRTALSELETKYIEREDPLYYIKYGPLALATVRPETKFGDTALAVNPKDKRYQKYIGKTIEARGVLGKLKFKVITDEAVDPHFGTGVIKVTPAHDPADFEIWQRHKSEIPGPKIVIDETGRLTNETGPYAGLKVAEAREKIAEDMKKMRILQKVEPRYKHNVATCYKCGNVLEPLLKPQWFIKMTEAPKAQSQKLKVKSQKSLRDMAVHAVKSGRIKFIPKRFEKVFFHWMKNLRDWNISRQIVWGIRIPAWYCEYDMKIIRTGRMEAVRTKDDDWVGIPTDSQIRNVKHSASFAANPVHIGDNPPSQCLKCKNCQPQQDPDVFDTWFSSGQWPFATLLAQSRSKSKIKSQKSKVSRTTKDFDTFYPTDVMETGWDILFFWVARMIMLGIYRTGKIPFKTVYLHGLVRDKDRQKMSKSKGNVIDPLGVAEVYGTDAVRMALVMSGAAGNDPVISEDKIRGYRNFATKIWNVARFILMSYDSKFEKIKAELSSEDKKNLKELSMVKKKVMQYIEKFEFNNAGHEIYHYIWHTLADKIIEKSKLRLKSDDVKERASAFKTNLEILVVSLKLLHPFMPFITEEIYQNLPTKSKKLLMVEQL